MVRDARVDDGHARDVDDDALRLSVHHVEQHALHDLMRAMAVDGADERQEEHALVDADHRRGELADRGLMAPERVEVRSDVRVDRERNVEEHDPLDAREGFPDLRLLLQLREEVLVDEVQVLTVRAEVPLGREPDPLVRCSDAQPVLDVGEITSSGEEAEEVIALMPLHATDRRFVAEELERLRMPEEERVELLDDPVGHLLRERPKRLQTREVLVAELEERATAGDLGLVELEDGHVLAVIVHVPLGPERLSAWRVITYHDRVAETAIQTLSRFARVVSDADAAQDVLALLASSLYEHVSRSGTAVFALGSDGKLRVAAQRGLELTGIETDFDDVDALAEKVRTATGLPGVHLNRPLVAGASLYGSVVMVCTEGDADPDLSLAEGLIDLAAVALSTASHVEQLERQFNALREQQEMLARTEKLRALGQMAAGVSHDLKNILNPLSLHLQLITRSLDRGNVADAKESAVEMKEVLQRGVQTLERLRDFSRQSTESKTELVDLDRLAREAVAIGKSHAASGNRRVPRIREELGAPPPVMAVSGEIVSALVNLVVNAVDAMNERGSTITLRSGEDDKGSWVEVSDDGPGMPPEVATRVFEPFFTTKGEKGTGLGLAMVYATLQRHGGTVTLDTAPSKGTTFRMTLPSSSPLSGSSKLSAKG